MSFRRFRNLMKNGSKKVSKNDIEINLWALGGYIFEIFGCFLRRQFFDEFSIDKKSAKNSKNGGYWGESPVLPGPFGRGRRVGRGAREAFGV